MAETPGNEPMRRVVSNPDDVAGLKEMKPSAEYTPVAYVEPDTLDQPMEDAERRTGVPQRLEAEVNRSVSSSSSLSENSTEHMDDDPLMKDNNPEIAGNQQRISSDKGDKTGNKALTEGMFTITGMDERMPPSPSPTHQHKGLPRSLHRMDSASSGSLRARSENSSNDWGYGWYEDVHGSEHQGGSNRSSDKKSSKRNGLVPQVSSRGEVREDLLEAKHSPGRSSHC